MSQNEEQIIADALLKIRAGIVAGDWTQVCEGYNSVSGEELLPPKENAVVINKLDKIRLLLKKPAAKTTESGEAVISTEVVADEDSVAVDLDKMNIKDLRAYAATLGLTKEIEGKKKPQILSVVKNALKDNKITVVTKKTDSGLQIITTAENPEEIARNALEASRKPKMPARQRTKIDLASMSRDKNPDAPVRYMDKPTTQPPWRS
jgi:hypothetical protein